MVSTQQSARIAILYAEGNALSMANAVELDVVLSRQEDGLWRAEVPALPGCWCDATTLEEALADIQSVVKLVLQSDRRRGLSLPARVVEADEIRLRPALPVTAV